MIEIVWKFIVREESRSQFELVFGRGGGWSELFSRSPGFRGSTLLRDTTEQRRYLLIDVWDTEEQRERAVADNRVAYEALEADFAVWTSSRRALGTFRLQAEATVRPAGKPRRRKPGGR